MHETEKSTFSRGKSRCKDRKGALGDGGQVREDLDQHGNKNLFCTRGQSLEQLRDVTDQYQLILQAAETGKGRRLRQ